MLARSLKLGPDQPLMIFLKFIKRNATLMNNEFGDYLNSFWEQFLGKQSAEKST